MSHTNRNIPFEYSFDHNQYFPIKTTKSPKTLNEYKNHVMLTDMMLDYEYTPSNREKQKANRVKVSVQDDIKLSCYGELKRKKINLDKKLKE